MDYAAHAADRYPAYAHPYGYPTYHRPDPAAAVDPAAASSSYYYPNPTAPAAVLPGDPQARRHIPPFPSAVPYGAASSSYYYPNPADANTYHYNNPSAVPYGGGSGQASQAPAASAPQAAPAAAAAASQIAAAKAPNGMAPEAIMHHAQWNAHVQPLKCEVCKVECDTQDVLMIHKAGKKHMKNLQKIQDSITPKPAEVAAAKSPNGMAPEADATVMHHAQWNAHFGHPLPRNAPKVVQPLKCEVCKVECDTQDVLVIHETGKKHQKNLQKLQDSIMPKPAKPPNRAVAASTSPAGAVAASAAPAAAVSNGAMPARQPKKNKRSAATPEDLEVKKRRVLEAGADQGEVKICTTCNVVVNSLIVYKFHIAGHKHKANVRKQEQASLPL